MLPTFTTCFLLIMGMSSAAIINVVIIMAKNTIAIMTVVWYTMLDVANDSKITVREVILVSANSEIIGENARRAREACGFSQTNVAEFLQVDQSLISKFEKGLRSLQSDMLERLANLYGHSITDFYCAEGIPELQIKAAYRSSGITANDMEAIHDIKRIALNLFFMSKLAGDDDVQR